jgi:hypothetical protein
VTEGKNTWRKSSYTGNTNCVEVAFGAEVGVRDSKQPAGAQLSFGPDQWLSFVMSCSSRARC